MNAKQKLIHSLFPNIDESNRLHKQLILHILSKYLMEEIKTNTEHYFELNGKKEGEYQAWHPNGKPWKQQFYRNGQLHGERKLWWNNGQMFEHSFYQNNELHGEYKDWHPNGKLWEHSFYHNGQLHGEYICLHRNGQQWRHYIYQYGVVLTYSNHPSL